MDNIERQIADRLRESAELKETMAGSQVDTIRAIAELMIGAYRSGGKVVLFGNGGSAADAQHIAAELVGKFLLKRQAFPAIALNTNTSIMTAIANDYTYDDVFTRQVEAIVDSGDVVVGISTSGDSLNVVNAIELANRKGAKTVGLTGGSGGRVAKTAALALIVPSASTPRVQEAHITIGHIICELVEEELAE